MYKWKYTKFILIHLILSAAKYQTVEPEIMRSNTLIPGIQKVFQKRAFVFNSQKFSFLPYFFKMTDFHIVSSLRVLLDLGSVARKKVKI